MDRNRTRPPGRPRPSERRAPPTRGHHVAKPTQRDQIRDAVKALRDGTPPRPDLADAVEARLATDSAAQRRTPTLPIYLPLTVWEHAETKAKAAGRTRSDEIEDGYRKLLAGTWAPAKPARTGGGAKVTRSIRLRDENLAAEVEAFVAAHAEEFGWSPSPAQVAAAWLELYTAL